MSVKSERATFGHKCKRVLQFIKLLSIEPCIFMVMFVNTIKSVPTDQLIQDKICLQNYNLSLAYCRELPKMTDEDDYMDVKSNILGELTTFRLYTSMITTIPSIMASLIIGGWVDRYENAKKAMFIAGAVAGMCEQLILIANVYFYDQCKQCNLSTISIMFINLCIF